MTQEDKELLLKDLCARLPYGVKVQYYDNETKKLEAGTIVSCTIPIDETNQKYPTFITRRDLLIIQGNTIEDIKPYLFPLSRLNSLTDEQKKTLKVLCDWNDEEADAQSILVLYQKHFVMKSDVIDWLHKNHFDYRGLIEKGLAIDATNKNIY